MNPHPLQAKPVDCKPVSLPHGIELSVRSCGDSGRPTLVFLHGFPEGAFVWDGLLQHFAAQGFRCIAPNLRGFERSSSPAEAAHYRVKFLVQDVAALIAVECGERALTALVAHDWGGAVAWNVANQLPHLMDRLIIINSPHPGTFMRDLKARPEQQTASGYMNFLCRPDAPALLAENDFARMWPFFEGAPPSAAVGTAWLTDAVKDQYRSVWRHGLRGGCNYYRASPLRPPQAGDAAATAIDLPLSMLHIGVPTTVIWGLLDKALAASLIDGLDAYIPHLTLHRIPDATHWIVHEQPDLVAALIGEALAAQP